MKIGSLLQNIEYNENHPAIKVIFDTEFTREIRIAMKQGQVMQEHQTSFPIVVEIVEGEIKFGAEKEILNLKKGDLISLGASVPHDLAATSDSIIRLTLTKGDRVDRVREVVA